MKARGRVYDDLGEGTWNLEVIRIFQTFKHLFFVQYWRAKRARKKKYINNNKKKTFGPPLLPIKHPHKTPPLTNLKGRGRVRTPGRPSGY